VGDRVRVGSLVKIIGFDKVSLKVEINEDTLMVPRFISALGQFVKEYDWTSIPPDAVMDEYFYLNGRYTIDEKLYIAPQRTERERDRSLEDLVGAELEGAILIGHVVLVYAIYVDAKVTERTKSDIEFFETVQQASFDHYAFDVFVVIQDEGSLIEYPLNIKYVTKM